MSHLSLENQTVPAAILTALLITVMASGCLGGDEETGEGDTEEKLTRRSGEPVTASAWVQSSQAATIEDVDVKHTVSMSIPNDKAVTATFTIKIIDGCGDREHETEYTNPDILKGEKIVGGGGGNATDGMGYEERIPGGSQTPASVTVDFRAPEGSYLPTNWEIHLEVTIRASDDQ